MRYILRLILPFPKYESDISSNHPSESDFGKILGQSICASPQLLDLASSLTSEEHYVVTEHARCHLSEIARWQRPQTFLGAP
jgi:hypothetical protein